MRKSSLFENPFAEKDSINIIYQISKQDLIDVFKEVMNECVTLVIPELLQHNEERLISKSEVMDILACSATTLWRMEKGGLIKAVGSGKQKRYKYQSICNYLKGVQINM